jgi:hypothetical protein
MAQYTFDLQPSGIADFSKINNLNLTYTIINIDTMEIIRRGEIDLNPEHFQPSGTANISKMDTGSPTIIFTNMGPIQKPNKDRLETADEPITRPNP